jgi:integrase/recombinase XerD
LAFGYPELIQLNWGSFLRNNRGDLLVDVLGKGGKERTLPVMDETESVLFEYRTICDDSTDINPNVTEPLFYSMYNKIDLRSNKKRLSYASLYKIVKEAVRIAGNNETVSPHWFRHTFVTALLEQDVPLRL